MNNIAFFLPTRRGSERVVNKNTRPFAGTDGGLLRLKINQLLEIPNIPIYLSTNDPESISIAKTYNNSRIIIIERPEHLCLSSTVLSDFIDYVPTIIKEEHIVWVHVTEPFITSYRLKESIEVYFDKISGSYDSLMSCNKLQTFLWDKENNNFISHDRSIMKWPRSQDLKIFYEINSAIFINSKDNYIKYGDRVGQNPFLFELSKIESIDIDWEEDFKIAELLYGAIK